MTDQIQTEGMGDEDSKSLFHIFFSIEWRVTEIWYIKSPCNLMLQGLYYINKFNYFFIASSIATATATVAPTIGLLPIPRNPIIST